CHRSGPMSLAAQRTAPSIALPRLTSMRAEAFRQKVRGQERRSTYLRQLLLPATSCLDFACAYRASRRPCEARLGDRRIDDHLFDEDFLCARHALHNGLDHMRDLE